MDRFFRFFGTIVFECVREIADFVQSYRQWCKANADEPQPKVWMERPWAKPGFERVTTPFVRKNVTPTPIAHYRVIGKHHVVIGDNGNSQHLKVRGGIRPGKNWVRPFGHSGQGQEHQKRELEPVLANQ